MRPLQTILLSFLLPQLLGATTLPKPSKQIALKTALSSSSVYLGEPLLMTVSWESAIPFSRIKAVDFSFPLLDDPTFQVLSPYTPNLESQPNTTGLPVHGTRILATRKTVKTAKKKYQSLSFQKILIPQKTGALQIPGSTLLCAVKTDKNGSTRNAFLYPAYFDNTFFDQELSDEKFERIHTQSPPLPLQVKPLPAGAPRLFSGLVGSFQIKASAKPQQVQLGNPVLLTLTISTPHFAEAIQLPPLHQQLDLAHSFKIPTDIELPQLQKNAKIYTIPLRPQSTSITSIPPIRLVFFDPEKKTYQTVQSDPIPLQVLSANALKSYGLSPSISPPERKNFNIPSSFTHSPLFQNTLLLFLLLPLLFLLWKLFHYLAKSSALALPLLHMRLPLLLLAKDQTQLYIQLNRILRAYLGQRLKLHAKALTFREVKKNTQCLGLEKEATDLLSKLFFQSETYRFTPPVKTPAQSWLAISRTKKAVQKLEKALRTSPKK